MGKNEKWLEQHKSIQRLSVRPIRCLENYPTSQRRTAPFQFVQGLYHRATGEIEAAHAAFEKALSFDERFIAARREMVALGEVGGGGTKPNILRDDLGTVISFYLNKNRRKTIRKAYERSGPKPKQRFWLLLGGYGSKNHGFKVRWALTFLESRSNPVTFSH